MAKVTPKNLPTRNHCASINGDVLANIIEQYMKSINESKLPDVDNAYKSAILLHLESYKEKMIREYESLISTKTCNILPLEDPHYPTLASDTEKDIFLLPLEDPHPTLTSDAEKNTLLGVHLDCYKLKYDELKRECEKFQDILGECNIKSQFKTVTDKLFINLRLKNYSISLELCRKIFQEEFWNKDILKNKFEGIKNSYLLKAKGPARHYVLDSQIKFIPGPPSVSIKPLSYNCLRLMWKAPSENAAAVSQYEIILTDSHTNKKSYILLSKEDQSETFNNLYANREYQFIIRGISTNNNCKGIMAQASHRVKAECPKKPAKPEVKIVDDPITDNTVKVSFTRPTHDDCCGSEVSKVELKITEKLQEDLVLRHDEMQFTDSSSPLFLLQLQRTISLPANAKSILFQVRFSNSVGSSDWSSPSKKKVSQFVPGPPKNVRSSVNSTAINLEWDEPMTFACSCDSYFVEIDQNGRKKVNDSSAIFYNLQPDTEFEIKVWSANMRGVLSEEVKLNVRTNKDVPSIPDKLSVKFISNENNRVELSGKLPKDNGSSLKEYKIQICPGNKIYAKILNEESADIMQEIIDLDELDLPIDNYKQEINFKVCYCNEIGHSDWSDGTALQCKDMVPLEVDNLLMHTSEPCTIKLEWDSQKLYRAVLREYLIEYVDESELIAHTQHVEPQDNNQTVIEKCKPNTNYKIIVWSVGYCDRRRGTKETIKTKSIPPNKPSYPDISFDENIQKVNVIVKTPTLEESNWSTASKFHLLVKSDCFKEEFDYVFETHEREQSKSVELNHGNKCTYYSFATSIENEAGRSEWSDSREVHVSRFLPGKPQEVKFDVSSTTVNVEWEEPLIFPKAVDYYEVIIEGPSNISIEPKCPLKCDQPIAKFQNLLPASKYTFTITVINTSGLRNEVKSEIETEKAPPEKPKCSFIPQNNELKITVMMPKCNGDPINGVYVKIDHFLSTLTGKSIPYILPHKSCPYVEEYHFKDIKPENEMNDVILELPNCPYNGNGELSYKIQVGCYNSKGCSQLSDSYNFPAKKLIPGFIKLNARGINKNSVYISWGPPDKYCYSAYYYRMFMQEKDSKFLFCDVQNCQVLISGLRSDTEYVFLVSAVNKEDKRGELSGKAIISTEVSKKKAAVAASIGAATVGTIGGPVTAVVATVKEIVKRVDSEEKAIPIVLGVSTLFSPVTGLFGAPLWGVWAGREAYRNVMKGSGTEIDKDTMKIDYNEFKEVPL